MSSTHETQSAARAAVVANLPSVIQDALKWDRSQWVDDGVETSDFYTVPAESANASPGDLLKVEDKTDTSKYTLPPATSLSRYQFQSETLDGTPVPVSGVVLWPYSPRSSKDGFQVVVWTHGTSGVAPNSAPSHLINLWQHYLGPFSLVLQGFVVVAPDYAGLGVSKTANGDAIVHEYLASPAHANDAIHALAAARKAFPQLGSRFVVMGHSQGGGAAWSVAQRQATKPTDGYLGAIAISPVTSAIEQPEPIRSWLGTGLLPSILRRHPHEAEAIVNALLTLEGKNRGAIADIVAATTLPTIAILSDCQLFQSNWTTHPHIQEYQEAIANGGRPIAGPLLVIQGESDVFISAHVVDSAVRATLDRFPSANLQYLSLPGLDHGPTITGSQRVWQDWLAERFAEASSLSGGPSTKLEPIKPALDISAYQPKLNWYLSVASEFYQTP